MDRNRDAGGTESIYNESLSARRAWIEIIGPKTREKNRKVALRKESVDRNFISLTACCKRIKVALRKESVDRNGYVGVLVVLWALVALRKESVDRNIGGRP